MISIRPEWCQKIMAGRKTIEVRKTKPKLETPFKCYIYCTKARERLIGVLRDGDENYGEIYHGKTVFIKTDEGSICDAWGKRQKVFGEFICDRIYELAPLNHAPDDAEQQACLTQEEIARYLKGIGYGWHISDLKIYDTPRELDDFRRACKNDWRCESCAMYCEHNGTCGNASLQIRRPPQSWCYVEEQTWKD